MNKMDIDSNIYQQTNPSITDEINEAIEVILEFVPSVLKKCSCCNKTVDDLFESESCEHDVCVDCRFENQIQCTFCVTKTEEKELNTETDINSLGMSCLRPKKVIIKDHIVNVQHGKQKCTVCNRVFLKSNARYHYFCATGNQPLLCPECGRRFVKKIHLDSHLNSHYGITPFKCSFGKCTASFTQKNKLVRHMKTHNSEKHICEVCDKTYSSLPVLQFHLQKVHWSAKLFKCDLCPRTYKYKRSLEVHRLKHQGLKEHLCEICGKKYTVASQLKQHKKSHVPNSRRPYSCKLRCKQRFITRQDKARHELIHEITSSPDYECSLCNTTFGRKDNLERHMKNFHQVPWDLESSVVKTMAVKPYNNVSLGNKNIVSIKKTNKSVKKSQYKLTSLNELASSSSKQNSREDVAKQSVKDKKIKQAFIDSEIVKPLAIIKPIENSINRELYSMITRPSVIQCVHKQPQTDIVSDPLTNIFDCVTVNSQTKSAVSENYFTNKPADNMRNINITPCPNQRSLQENETRNTIIRTVCQAQTLKGEFSSKINADLANVKRATSHH